jgi:rhodanese-related sulfurtransferase
MMVRQISREQLQEMMKAARFKLVDVFSRERYEKEHIKRAISLPVNEIEQKASSVLCKNDLIVVYCASFECQASTRVAEKLMSMGFKNVLDYKGGLEDYKEAKLPLEGSLHKSSEEQVASTCDACCDIC